MKEKDEKERKQFIYEQPKLVPLIPSRLDGATTQCNAGSVASVGCTAGTAV